MAGGFYPPEPMDYSPGIYQSGPNNDEIKRWLIFLELGLQAFQVHTRSIRHLVPFGQALCLPFRNGRDAIREVSKMLSTLIMIGQMGEKT